MSETMANILRFCAILRATIASVKLCNPRAPPLDFSTKSMSKVIGITLLGCGTVGSGVLRILTDQAQLLRQRTGCDYLIRHVVVRDTAKPRAISENIKCSS